MSGHMGLLLSCYGFVEVLTEADATTNRARDLTSFNCKRANCGYMPHETASAPWLLTTDSAMEMMVSDGTPDLYNLRTAVPAAACPDSAAAGASGISVSSTREACCLLD